MPRTLQFVVEVTVYGDMTPEEEATLCQAACGILPEVVDPLFCDLIDVEYEIEVKQPGDEDFE